jgi:gamma-glutamyltranspeptidase/glutathione hydrolase
MPPTNPIARPVAATPHPEAAAAARMAYAQGGNAVDAACAAVLALCVVTPPQVGFGGYGGCMVAYLAERDAVVALDFDSRAPLAYRDELFMPDPAAASTYGYLAVTVPAVVAGIDLALRSFGRLAFRDAAAHAQHLAEHGFPMDAGQRKMLDDWKNRTDPTSLKAHFADGSLPDVGEPWVQPDLATLIRTLRDEGPAAMYRGDIPRRIVRQVREHGGILSEEDFAAYAPTVVEPVVADWRGHRLFTPPPPAGGITALQILKALEHVGLAAMPPNGAAYFHAFAEAAKACWHDRERHLGDPDAGAVPAATLLSDARAAAIAAAVKAGGGGGGGPPVTAGPAGGEHTVNVVAADRAGNVVSLTATQGNLFGSQVVIDGLGLVLNHGMSRFTYTPGHPNAPAPGKRMHHNMSPVVALRDGRPRFATGMPGGEKIVNVTAQIAINLVEFDRPPAEAIAAPRLHTQGGEPLAVTPDMPADVVAQLEAMGHQVTRAQTLGGPANLAVIDPATGEVEAVSGHGADCVFRHS